MTDSRKKDRQAGYGRKSGQRPAFRKGHPGRRPRRDRTIVIEVQGGVVADVAGIPPGYDYQVIDHDMGDIEEP